MGCQNSCLVERAQHKDPLLFRESKAVALCKTDLLPYVPFDFPACRVYIEQIHAQIPVFEISSLKGSGIGVFIDWLRRECRVELIDR